MAVNLHNRLRYMAPGLLGISHDPLACNYMIALKGHKLLWDYWQIHPRAKDRALTV